MQCTLARRGKGGGREGKEGCTMTVAGKAMGGRGEVERREGEEGKGCMHGS